MQGKTFAILAIAIAVGGVAVLAFGNLGKNLVYYWTPSELRAAGDKAGTATVRLGGQVEAGSVLWDGKGSDLKFRVTDGKVAVPVEAHSVPPQMFREGIGVVVEGNLGADGVFRSERLLVKHGEEYQAPDGTNVDMQKLGSTVLGGDS
jgi:cytochrome c-type biogenesis protein CcmE